jgi:hypothetical protein
VVTSEAAQYQAIRRYWKKLYNANQRAQQLDKRIVDTRQYRNSTVVWNPDIENWDMRYEWLPASDVRVEAALKRAWQAQSDVAFYAQLLNHFKVPHVRTEQSTSK